MPFLHAFPHPFTLASIRDHTPVLSGVYGISNASEWIYIGETDNIQEALLLHCGEPKGSLWSLKPTGFVFETCDRAARTKRQDRLVLEFEPAWNRHWCTDELPGAARRRRKEI